MRAVSAFFLMLVLVAPAAADSFQFKGTIPEDIWAREGSTFIPTSIYLSAGTPFSGYVSYPSPSTWQTLGELGGQWNGHPITLQNPDAKVFPLSFRIRASDQYLASVDDSALATGSITKKTGIVSTGWGPMEGQQPMQGNWFKGQYQQIPSLSFVIDKNRVDEIQWVLFEEYGLVGHPGGNNLVNWTVDKSTHKATNSVPEPSTWSLVAGGLIAILASARRQIRNGTGMELNSN